MHELSLVSQIVKTIDEVYDAQGLSEVSSIVLEIGEMSDVVPVYIEEAWKSVAPTTRYPDAKMKLNIIPAVAKCLSCNFEDSVKNFGFTCPKCDSETIKLISGREFFIKEIVAK